LVVFLSTIYCEKGWSIETIDLCTLDENIQTYKEQRVRVSAFISESYESAVLYDPKCQDGKPLVHFVLKTKVGGKIKLLKKTVEERGYAFTTVEGIVRGPEPIQIAPQLADKVKELYKGNIPVSCYGHLNAYKMEIEIDKVLEVKAIDDGLRDGVDNKMGSKE